MPRLQVYVSEELLERLRRAAEKEDWSVSYLAARSIEREWGDAPPLLSSEAASGERKGVLRAPMERSFHPLGCPHDEVEKRTTPTLGTRRYCADPGCGALLP